MFLSIKCAYEPSPAFAFLSAEVPALSQHRTSIVHHAIHRSLLRDVHNKPLFVKQHNGGIFKSGAFDFSLVRRSSGGAIALARLQLHVSEQRLSGVRPEHRDSDGARQPAGDLNRSTFPFAVRDQR